MTENTVYVELRCNSCKHTMMATRKAVTNPVVDTRCAHCQSQKIRPTGRLGFAATNDEVKRAMEKATYLVQNVPDEEVDKAALAAAMRSPGRWRPETGLRIEGAKIEQGPNGETIIKDGTITSVSIGRG